LRRILNVLTDGAVPQFSGREFQRLGAATEKRRAAVSKLCIGTDRINESMTVTCNKLTLAEKYTVPKPTGLGSRITIAL